MLANVGISVRYSTTKLESLPRYYTRRQTHNALSPAYTLINATVSSRYLVVNEPSSCKTNTHDLYPTSSVDVMEYGSE